MRVQFYHCAAFGTGLPSSLRGGGPASTGCTQADLGPETLVRSHDCTGA